MILGDFCTFKTSFTWTESLQKHFLNDKWDFLRHVDVIMMAENIISVALWILWHKILLIANNNCAFFVMQNKSIKNNSDFIWVLFTPFTWNAEICLNNKHLL